MAFAKNRVERTNHRNYQKSHKNGLTFRKSDHNLNRTNNGFAKTFVQSPNLTKVPEVYDNRLKLFIKNIPNDGEAVRSKVHELLEPCGEIIHERYFSRRRGSHTIYSALIVFKSPASVTKSLEVHGSLVEERHLIVSSYAQYSGSQNGINIKNLSWDATEEDLWNLFESIGKILFINICNPVNLNASNQPLEGEVIFQTEEAVKEALFFDNAEIRGLPVVISRISRDAKASQPDLAVHVSGLPQDVSKEKVINLLDKCGIVRMVKVNFKLLTAVVHFTSEEGVKAALQLDGTLLEGNRLSVRQRQGDILNLDVENPVFVYNIPESVRDVDIFLAFQECGYIIEVRFLRRKAAASSKRALIQFKYPDSVVKALELDGLVLGGERVSVSNSEKCLSSEEIGGEVGTSANKFNSKNRKHSRTSPQSYHQKSKRSRQN